MQTWFKEQVCVLSWSNKDTPCMHRLIVMQVQKYSGCYKHESETCVYNIASDHSMCQTRN